MEGSYGKILTFAIYREKKNKDKEGKFGIHSYKWDNLFDNLSALSTRVKFFFNTLETRDCFSNFYSGQLWVKNCYLAFKLHFHCLGTPLSEAITKHFQPLQSFIFLCNKTNINKFTLNFFHISSLHSMFVWLKSCHID